MPHVPDTVPGKRVTDAGARTEGRGQPSNIRGGSRMQESCPYGSVRGAPSNGCPYRNEREDRVSSLSLLLARDRGVGADVSVQPGFVIIMPSPLEASGAPLCCSPVDPEDASDTGPPSARCSGSTIRAPRGPSVLRCVNHGSGPMIHHHSLRSLRSSVERQQILVEARPFSNSCSCL